MEEYFKDLKGLPLGLSTNNAWDYSIHMAHKMFQYWLYLVYKILHLNKVSIEMKELLIYKLNKDLLFYNTNYQHVLIFSTAGKLCYYQLSCTEDFQGIRFFFI